MNEQQRLLNVIWNDDPFLLAESGFDAQGVQIYRRNLLASAQRALSITFPTIFALLDSDISKNLLSQFLKLCPPDQGDWAQWGEEFADFIATDQISHEYPYLPDCAALDWKVHKALHGKDQVVDQLSLQRLSDTSPEKIGILFNKNVALIETKYPICDIFQAHHHSDLSLRNLAMTEAKLALSKIDEKKSIMVSRPALQPKVTKLTHSEAQFMQVLYAGKSLDEALNSVEKHKNFSFEKWLMMALEQNLIFKFKNI